MERGAFVLEKPLTVMIYGVPISNLLSPYLTYRILVALIEFHMIGSIPLACNPIVTFRRQLGVAVETLSVNGILLSRVNLIIKFLEALLLSTIKSLILSPPPQGYL